MSLRAKIALVVAVLFSLVNLLGAGYALVHWELLHAGLHIVLTLLGVWVVWRIAPRRVASY